MSSSDATDMRGGAELSPEGVSHVGKRNTVTTHGRPESLTGVAALTLTGTAPALHRWRATLQVHMQVSSSNHACTSNSKCDSTRARPKGVTRGWTRLDGDSFQPLGG